MEVLGSVVGSLLAGRSLGLLPGMFGLSVKSPLELPLGFSRQYLTLQSGKMFKVGRANRASESAECGKCLAASGEQFPGRQRH